MASVPNAIALATIPDGALAVASTLRNDFAATQVAVNGIIAVLDEADAKGDLLVGSGADALDNLTVGLNGQTLVADSSQTLGVRWGAGVPYRKTAVKAVNTTTGATDLLNAEVTLAAGILGTTGGFELDAWGDWVQNTGGGVVAPRFQLLLGGTTIFDTGVGPSTTSNAGRGNWNLTARILNAGSASAQTAYISFRIYGPGGFALTQGAFTTGTGFYMAPVATLAPGFGDGYTTATVNTAVAAALVLNVINGSGSASYETKLSGATVEVF